MFENNILYRRENDLYGVIYKNEIQEYIIIYIFNILVTMILSSICQTVYIPNINFYIEADNLKLLLCVLDISIVVFVVFLDKVILLSKAIIMLIPIFLVYTLNMLSVKYYIGLILIILCVFIIIFYPSLYLMINRNKRIRFKILIYKTLLLISFITFLSIPSLMICKNMKVAATIPSSSEVNVSENNSMIEHEMDQLKKLNKEVWYKIDDIEKINCLQTIVNIESTYLGISDAPTVEAVNLESTILGQYINEKNIIQVNLTYLETKSTNEILKTILHECRHKYQHKVVESCDFTSKEKINLMFYAYPRMLKESFSSYSPDISSEDYYYSFVEIDAREYAERAIKEYNNKISNIE